MSKATIKDFTGLDGCGMLIVLENGDEIEPSNLNNFSSSVIIAPPFPVEIIFGIEKEMHPKSPSNPRCVFL
jgi:hypothetical protein